MSTCRRTLLDRIQASVLWLGTTSVLRRHGAFTAVSTLQVQAHTLLQKISRAELATLGALLPEIVRIVRIRPPRVFVELEITDCIQNNNHPSVPRATLAPAPFTPTPYSHHEQLLLLRLRPATLTPPRRTLSISLADFHTSQRHARSGAPAKWHPHGQRSAERWTANRHEPPMERSAAAESDARREQGADGGHCERRAGHTSESRGRWRGRSSPPRSEW